MSNDSYGYNKPFLGSTHPVLVNWYQDKIPVGKRDLLDKTFKLAKQPTLKYLDPEFQTKLSAAQLALDNKPWKEWDLENGRTVLKGYRQLYHGRQPEGTGHQKFTDDHLRFLFASGDLPVNRDESSGILSVAPQPPRAVETINVGDGPHQESRMNDKTNQPQSTPAPASISQVTPVDDTINYSNLVQSQPQRFEEVYKKYMEQLGARKNPTRIKVEKLRDQMIADEPKIANFKDPTEFKTAYGKFEQHLEELSIEFETYIAEDVTEQLNPASQQSTNPLANIAPQPPIEMEDSSDDDEMGRPIRFERSAPNVVPASLRGHGYAPPVSRRDIMGAFRPQPPQQRPSRVNLMHPQ